MPAAEVGTMGPNRGCCLCAHNGRGGGLYPPSGCMCQDVTIKQDQWQAGEEAWEPGIEVAVGLGQVLERSASQGGYWRDQEVQTSS